MKQPLFLLLAILAIFTASAQQPAKDSTQPRPGNHYSADSFRLRVPGRRISLYAFCTPYHEGSVIYFRKDQDEAIHRLNYQNLSVALADNPTSTMPSTLVPYALAVKTCIQLSCMSPKLRTINKAQLPR